MKCALCYFFKRVVYSTVTTKQTLSVVFSISTHKETLTTKSNSRIEQQVYYWQPFLLKTEDVDEAHMEEDYRNFSKTFYKSKTNMRGLPRLGVDGPFKRGGSDQGSKPKKAGLGTSLSLLCLLFL